MVEQVNTQDAHPVDVHVGQQLRNQRQLLGISQKAVGEAVGVTFQQVQKYERGVNRISAGVLHDFARVLRVPITYFFEGLSQSGVSYLQAFSGASYDVHGFAEPAQNAYGAGPSAAPLTKEQFDVLAAYQKISDPKLRKKVLDLMHAMADA